MQETIVLVALVALSWAAVWRLVPRCPECGSLVSIRDSIDPSLRHCRRCLSIYRLEKRD